GDTFNSALMISWLEGSSEAEALRFANAAAALVVSSPRGILGCPDRNQVEAFLQAHRPEKDPTEGRVT
ncbi:MAG: PfkB family carbohydrate kinase, partial [Anaerolineales bacterium]